MISLCCHFNWEYDGNGGIGKGGVAILIWLLLSFHEKANWNSKRIARMWKKELLCGCAIVV